jgi:hypothetical protein
MEKPWQKSRQKSFTNTSNLPSSSTQSRSRRDRQTGPIPPLKGELEYPVQQSRDRYDKPLRVLLKAPREPNVYYNYDPNEHVPVSLPYDRSGSLASNRYNINKSLPPLPPRRVQEPEINGKREYIPMPPPPTPHRRQPAKSPSSSSKAIPQPRSSYWSGHTTQSEANSRVASCLAEQAEIPKTSCSKMSVDQIQNEGLRDILSCLSSPPKRPRDHNRGR